MTSTKKPKRNKHKKPVLGKSTLKYRHRLCDKAIESGDYNKIRKQACKGCGGNRRLT